MIRRLGIAVNRLPVKPTRLVCRVLLALAAMGFATPASAEYFQFGTMVTILAGSSPVFGLNPISGMGTAVTMTTPAGIDITLSGQDSSAFGENIDGTGAGSDIVFGNIDISGLTHNSPLENVTILYVFHVIVSDYLDFNSGGLPQASVTFDIAGQVMGTVGKTGGGAQVNLSLNMYNPGNVLTKQIGNELYTLNLNNYVPPGPTNTGAFGVHVSAVLIPEPGTIALLGSGLLALATPAYRRWRRRSPVEAV